MDCGCGVEHKGVLKPCKECTKTKSADNFGFDFTKTDKMTERCFQCSEILWKKTLAKQYDYWHHCKVTKDDN